MDDGRPLNPTLQNIIMALAINSAKFFARDFHMRLTGLVAKRMVLHNWDSLSSLNSLWTEEADSIFALDYPIHPRGLFVKRMNVF